MRRAYLLGLPILLSICATILAANEGSPALAALRKQLPTPGTVLVDVSDLSELDLQVTDGKVATFKEVPVAGRTFAQAIRAQVMVAGTNPWDAQVLSTANAAPIRKGDVILIAFDARTIDAKRESGQAVFHLGFQHDVSPWEQVVSFDGDIARDWQTIYAVGVADRDWPAGQVVLSWHLAQLPQTLEIGGIVVLDLGANVDQTKLPHTPVTYAGREPDAPWRKAAAERIEKYRKGGLVVTVTDAAGKPVSGADVTIDMTKHAYGFGSFLEGPMLDQSADGQRYRDTFLTLFSSKATTPLYWHDWGWANPKARADYFKMAQWLKDNHIPARGHNLIWPSWHNMPKGIEKLKSNPALLRTTLRDHVHEVMEAMKPYDLAEVDVMNEPRAEHEIMDLLGRDVMVDWFEEAKKTDPRPLLFVNEYSILTGGGSTDQQQDIYAETIQYLVDHGAPLDGIGMQGHFGSDLTPPDRVLQILDRFAKFNKPIEVTEFTVDCRDEQAQGDYERDFMTIVFSHPATNGIVRWGFWEGQIWLPTTAQFRRDWSLKPNGKAYEDLVLNQWWTHDRGKTPDSGRLSFRGFYGDYSITVRSANQTRTVPVSLRKTDSATQITVKLDH